MLLPLGRSASRAVISFGTLRRRHRRSMNQYIRATSSVTSTMPPYTRILSAVVRRSMRRMRFEDRPSDEATSSTLRCADLSVDRCVFRLPMTAPASAVYSSIKAAEWDSEDRSASSESTATACVPCRCVEWSHRTAQTTVRTHAIERKSGAADDTKRGAALCTNGTLLQELRAGAAECQRGLPRPMSFPDLKDLVRSESAQLVHKLHKLTDSWITHRCILQQSMPRFSFLASLRLQIAGLHIAGHS